MTENSTEDYVKYRINRAHETIAEIKVLVENRYWNTAINRRVITMTSSILTKKLL